MMGYCLKCRAKKTMKNGKRMNIKGRSYMMGQCATCGTKMSMMV